MYQFNSGLIYSLNVVLGYLNNLFM